MKPVDIKITLISILIALWASAFGTASAHSSGKGHWAFDPGRCPDLVEDKRDRIESRIDEAYDNGPRDVYEDYLDRRESAIDEASTYCPASAWVWRGGTYHKGHHAARPGGATLYNNAKARSYYRYGKNNQRIVVVKF